MSQTIVRVELHGATENDYQILHVAMSRLGFSRYVTDAAGIKFLLPTAEYSAYSDLSAAAIRTSVMSAAESTGRSFWVLVSKTSETDWFLQTVN